jgi:hypothetical protein
MVVYLQIKNLVDYIEGKEVILKTNFKSVIFVPYHMVEEQDCVKLSERLNVLVGHEVIVIIRNDEGEIKIPEVILEEVGEDYLSVLTKFNDDTQYSPPNEHRFIILSNVVQIVHKAGCNECAK